MSNEIADDAKRVLLEQPEALVSLVRWTPLEHEITASAHDTVWMWWWAPTVGPTGTLLLAYMHHLVVADHADVDMRAVSVQLGIGNGWTKNNPLLNSAGRLCAVGLMDVQPPAEGQSFPTIRVANPIRRPATQLLERTAKRIEEITA